jgi:hypothetical protein
MEKFGEVNKSSETVKKAPAVRRIETAIGPEEREITVRGGR